MKQTLRLLAEELFTAQVGDTIALQPVGWKDLSMRDKVRFRNNASSRVKYHGFSSTNRMTNQGVLVTLKD